MTSYTHTAADALALAATCEKRIASGTGVALNAAQTHLAMMALKFWQEHHKFAKGDKIVYADNFDGDELFTVSYSDTGTVVAVEPDDNLDYYGLYRPASSAEIEAGHRIDKVNSIKCWSCEAIIELEQLKNNDGFCPECNAEIENDEVQSD